ncbi:hypothetical protein PoB_004655100 [Plakobranchus ocellatus]|uniref:Uncharacterized protein n=1 Tax=Plakobranchus ocellatus TaxID=259542 RepID=A0AAV4BHW5_9GAST|nr:hypothetical protein PoB_004655100 [Plakobranchus ocellatus]
MAARYLLNLFSKVKKEDDSGRSETSTQKMDEILDSREQEFVDKVEKYVSEVKAAMKDETAETAGKMFHSAMTVLNQDLPDPACQERERQTRHYESDISEEMKVLKEKPNASEKQMRESQKEAQKNVSPVELQVSVSADSTRNNVLRLTRIFMGLKSQVKPLDPEIIKSSIDLSEVSTENCEAVKGLRKLLALLREKNQRSKICNAIKSLYNLQALSRQKNQAAAAATPPLTAPIASALSRLLKDVSELSWDPTGRDFSVTQYSCDDMVHSFFRNTYCFGNFLLFDPSICSNHAANFLSMSRD